MTRALRHRTALLAVLVGAAAAGTLVPAQQASDVGERRHRESLSAGACAACHSAPTAVRTPTPRGGCDAQCISCHQADTVGHHRIANALPADLPAPLVRSTDGRLACRTCHDLSRPLQDSVAWRAQSLFDAVFRRRAVHPTYRLAMRNHNGQLCQICH